MDRNQATSTVDDHDGFEEQVLQPLKDEKDTLLNQVGKVKAGMKAVTLAIQQQDRAIARTLRGKGAKLDIEDESEKGDHKSFALIAAIEHMFQVSLKGDGSKGCFIKWEAYWGKAQPTVLRSTTVVEKAMKQNVCIASHRYLNQDCKDKDYRIAKLRGAQQELALQTILAESFGVDQEQMFAKLVVMGKKGAWAKELAHLNFASMAKNYASVL